MKQDIVAKIVLVLSVVSCVILIVSTIAFSNNANDNAIQDTCWAMYQTNKSIFASYVYFGLKSFRITGFNVETDDVEQGDNYLFDVDYVDCSSNMCDHCHMYGIIAFSLICAAAILCLPVITIVLLYMRQFLSAEETIYKQQFVVTVCALLSSALALAAVIVFMVGCFPDIQIQYKSATWGPGAYTGSVGALFMLIVGLIQCFHISPPPPVLRPPPPDQFGAAPYPFMVNPGLEM